MYLVQYPSYHLHNNYHSLHVIIYTYQNNAFLFLAAQFEFMTWFPTMILYFRVFTGFTAGLNIKWDVLHALQFCTGRYSYCRMAKENFFF